MTPSPERRRVAPSDNWIKANLIAALMLIGSVLFGLVQVSSIAGEFRQSMRDLDKRVIRLENKSFPDR